MFRGDPRWHKYLWILLKTPPLTADPIVCGGTEEAWIALLSLSCYPEVGDPPSCIPHILPFWGGGRSTYQALKPLSFFFSGSLFQEYSRDMENAYAVYCNGYTRSTSLLQSYQETPSINEKIQEVLEILQWVPLLALYAAKHIATVELKDVKVHCCFLNKLFKASLFFVAPLPPRPSMPKIDYRSTPYNKGFFM